MELYEPLNLLSKVHSLNQRTLTIGGSLTVQLTSCLTGSDLTKQVKLWLIQYKHILSMAYIVHATDMDHMENMDLLHIEGPSILRRTARFAHQSNQV